MKKLYTTPVLQEVGGVAGMTAAFGSAARTDFSEFPEVQPDSGSFDVCDGNSNNNPDGSFCE